VTQLYPRALGSVSILQTTDIYIWAARGYFALIGRYIRASDWVAAGTSCGPERGSCGLLIGYRPVRRNAGVRTMVRCTEALKRAVSYCGTGKGSSCLAGQDEDVLEDGLMGVSPQNNQTYIM
jgi:hypothetical protein